MSNITLRYKGLNCFGETDELSGSDEIYLITVVTSVEGGRAVVRTEKHPVGISVYEDVDKGASFGGPIAPCYSGEARPLSLVVTLMEQDEGDPNAFRDRIDAVVKAGAAASAAEGVPIPEIGQKLLGDVANAVIGSGDDVISQVALTFEPDALIAEARKPRLREQEVEHTFFTFHSGQGATYKAYFDIVEEGGPISPGGQTRKHPHSGNFIQSSFGRQGNFELLVPVGGRLVHFFRANDEAGLPWHRVAELPNSVNAAGAALIQSNFGGNFEVVARLGDGLVFYFFDAAVLQWRGPFPILVDGQPITGVTGF